MIKKFFLIIFSILSILFFIAENSFSHGINYEIIDNTVNVKTFFEDDTPFYPATVKVYSPENYDKVYLEGQNNENGVFSFQPNKPGEWIIMVRDKSGHGVRVNVKVKENLTVDSGENFGSLSMTQKLIMAGCVLWGLFGTALFFRRKTKNAHR